MELLSFGMEVKKKKKLQKTKWKEKEILEPLKSRESIMVLCFCLQWVAFLIKKKQNHIIFE